MDDWRDSLDERSIHESLTTRWLARPAHYFSEVPSTNDILQEMADGGAPAGTMVITDFQSRGKGRLGRRWEAPPGTSLLLSLLFRPGWPAARSAWLTMAAGLAAAAAVAAEADVEVGLKWPNDLMVAVDGEWRKCGGLLLETRLEAGVLQQAILGMGLNVNIPPAQLPAAATPAASLMSAGGRVVPRLPLLASFLRRLEARYEAAAQGHSPQPAWNRRLINLGQEVQVRTRTATVAGTAEGSDAWGRLLVRDAAGKLHAIAAGDVSLRR